MNKYRAWDKEKKEMYEVACIDFIKKMVCVLENDSKKICRWISLKKITLLQFTEMYEETSCDDIWEFDLLEVESPKGKFIAKVVKEYGTFGIVAVKGRIVDYFWDHWNDDFMPLVDIYWNENGDDGCLPGTKRLGTSFENPELLKEVE